MGRAAVARPASCAAPAFVPRTAIGQSLAVGDRVAAARFAGTAPIKVIDSFTLERSGPRREGLGHCRPVKVRRGALGPGSPRRDLCLTAAHAVLVDGFLMPIGQLVNGTSIVLEAAEGHDALDFFHIELERHAVLEAEGAPCESRIDAVAETCAPMLSFGGGRGELRSRLRSAAALVIDRRQPIDLIRDRRNAGCFSHVQHSARHLGSFLGHFLDSSQPLCDNICTGCVKLGISTND